MRNISIQFSRAAETYERWAIPQRESAHILVDFVKPKGKVLDLGCGTGFVSEYLENCEVVGLDISESMLNAYREKFSNAVLGNAEELPFKSESFDYVLSNFALHWTNIEKSIKEALRVCKVGIGIAIPVKGSLNFSEFPFPEAEEIIRKIEPEFYKILDLEIPFKGIDFLKFFHYTGTSNFKGKKRLKTRKEIIELSKNLNGEIFRTLFFIKLKYGT